MFLKWIEVPTGYICQLKLSVLESTGLWGESKVPMPPLNDFSDFIFFEKIAIFVTLKITHLKKSLVFLQFPTLILHQLFLYISV